MIIRQAQSSLKRYGTAPQPSRRLYDGTRLVLGHPPVRRFHASRPDLMVNEVLQLSSAAFHFVHDTTGLAWGLSILLTSAAWQLAFTPIHYWAERNRKLRGHGANLLHAWRSIYSERQALARKDELPTEVVATMAESEVKRQLRLKEKQIRAETGYRGIWLNYTTLLYIPVWLSNNAALVEMCGSKKTGIVSAAGTNGIALEPALTTDGILWFSDLTVADPTYLLPIATSVMFVATTLQINRARSGPPTRLQDLIFIFALFSGPIAIATGASNANLLAILGSTVVNIVRRSWLDKSFGTTTTEVRPARPRTSVLKKQYRSDARR